MVKQLVPVIVEFKEKLDKTTKVTSDGWRIKMPVGSEIIAFGTLPPKGDLAAFVLREQSGVLVDHPILLIPLGGGFEPIVGRKIGKHFGISILPNLGPVGIFADEPWPQPPKIIQP